jgi:hypothetical protein
MTRVQFEIKQRELKKKAKAAESQYNFKPRVNTHSKDIAVKYREKMDNG